MDAMIRYHGTPITPESACVQILKGRHGMVSFAHPEQIGTVAEMCQSFVLDNGAFSHWRAGHGVIDLKAYAEWVMDWYRHPGFDWCLVPDVIDGTEQDNEDMLHAFNSELAKMVEWRQPEKVEVWHLHESIDRLKKQVARGSRRIAIGSSGEFSQPGSDSWRERMDEAFKALCDMDGRPRVKIHGLRMMDPTLFSRYPFSSVDSCNVARNIGLDKAWDSFKYGRAIRKSVRGVIIAQHCEDHASASVWNAKTETQYRLLFG